MNKFIRSLSGIPSADSRRAVVSTSTKYWLPALSRLSRKKVYRPMTIHVAIDWDVKHQIKQKKSISVEK